MSTKERRSRKPKLTEEGYVLKTYKSTNPGNKKLSVWVKAYDEYNMLVWQRGIADVPTLEEAKRLVPILEKKPDIVPGYKVLTF
jgi:hypothetical protein